jgi:hypothetical protein
MDLEELGEREEAEHDNA